MSKIDGNEVIVLASSEENKCNSHNKREEEIHPCMITLDACLFDDQEDDEDDNVEITLENDISSTSSSLAFNVEGTLRQDRKRSSNMADGSQKKRKNKSTTSPVTKFSEDMSGMDICLCPASFENENKTVATHAKLTAPSHKRGSSDTDYFQKLISSNHCLSMLVNISEPCGKRSRNRKKPANPCNLGGAPCTDMDVQNLRKNLTEDIMSLFGFAKFPCDTDISSRSEEHNYTISLNHHRSILQNRCVLRNAQRERVQRLRRKWHSPFGIDSYDNHPEISPAHRSLDDVEIGYEGKTLKESLYYDSDPELPVMNRKELTRAGKTYLWPIDTSASFESTGFGPCPQTPTAMQRVNALSFESHSPACSADTMKSEQLSFDLWNDKEVKRLVKELTVGRINLLWHPKESDVTLDEGVSPTSVVAWFENGVGIQSTMIQPKFVW
eukprot:CAMPEP_0194201972 /NCGR_PEP_ID=MMETSP0156-20130528/2118_1 /TAXON_ID=33649 /ORGANISM="Thalassionema nitzschioides, Strain L26-B" /LENGTH=439 /DNA_ID=CAMNT_0038927325 /DNA_START=33 /DNA_END=1349 /DNA_ORIENTATION=-